MGTKSRDEKLNELQFELEYWEGKKEESINDTEYFTKNIDSVKSQIKEVKIETTN